MKKLWLLIFSGILMHVCKIWGGHGVMVIVVGNGYGNQSSNPGQGCSHFSDILGKDMYPAILPPAMSK